jgi:hypothetical protein
MMKRKKRLIGSRMMELVALGMIGDGALALADPRRHTRLWLEGPRPWRKAMKSFVRRPGLTRTLGVLGLGAGLLLASRQRP